MSEKDAFKEKPRGGIFKGDHSEDERVFYGRIVNPTRKEEMLLGLRHYQFKCPSCGAWFDHTRELIEYHTTHADVAYAMLKVGMVYLSLRLKKNNGGGEMPVSKEEQEIYEKARPKSLKATDLVDGKTVAITDVNLVQGLRSGPSYTVKIEGPGVATLNAEKKHVGELILNATNRDAIEKKAGSKNPNDWVGAKLTVMIVPGTRNPSTGGTIDGVRLK